MAYLHVFACHVMLELIVIHPHGATVTDVEGVEADVVYTSKVQIHHVVHLESS